MLLLMNSRIVSKLFDKINIDRNCIDYYYTTTNPVVDNDKSWIYKNRNRKFYVLLFNNLCICVSFLMLSFEKCLYFFKSMSHPSTYMATGRCDVACGNMDDTTTHLTGFVDNGTQTSSYGSIPPNDRSSYISINERTPLLGRRPTHQRSGINIGVLALGVLFIGGVTIGTYLLIIEDRPYQSNYPFDLVYRESWNAIDAIYRGKKLNNSLAWNVYVTHTGGSTCDTFVDCAEIVKNLQYNSIQSSQNATDLPFNFLIGGDGKTYEVRGWNYEMGLVSIHLDPTTSLLIGLIGNFTYLSPDHKQIDEIKSVLSESQRRKKLLNNYNVFGIRNVSISLLDGLEFISILKLKFDHYRFIIEVT